jgi:hypothetical protein
VHHGEVEPVFEVLELLAKSHAVPVTVSVEEDHRPDVVPIGHRPQHADQSGDPDAACD